MPICEFFLNPAADFNAIFRRHCDVPTVKERMHVLSEQNPIVYRVRPLIGVRSYVSCFQTCSTGEPVNAQRLLYASVTSTRKDP